MKIVKEGKWKIPWSTEAVCKTCEAVILVEEGDVMPTYDKTDKFYWLCAVCGKTNDLASKNIAQRVCEAVERQRKYDTSDW